MDQVIQSYWRNRHFACANDKYESWNQIGQYFFLTRELKILTGDQYADAIKRGHVRHCIPYKGKYYDYIAKKEFNTLIEWVKNVSQDETLYSVVYGTNHRHRGGKTQYIRLEDLLAKYGFILSENYTEHEEEEKIDFDFILDFNGLTIDDVWVIKNGDVKPFKHYMKTLV